MQEQHALRLANSGAEESNLKIFRKRAIRFGPCSKSSVRNCQEGPLYAKMCRFQQEREGREKAFVPSVSAARFLAELMSNYRRSIRPCYANGLLRQKSAEA